MDGGWFNIDHSGMIYTEDEQSKSIKYLQTLEGNNYNLYGNGKRNVMECNENKNCLMYTSGGNDEVNQQQYSKDIYITDFNDKNDKIILHYKSWLAAIGHPNNTEESFYNSGKLNAVIPLGGRYDSNLKMIGGDQVVVQGYTPDKVEGWVDVATGKKKVDPSVFADNPIIIK